jgi:flagellar biosynthetic protein FliR
MLLRVDPAWAALILLVGLRVAPLFVMAPVLGSARAPNLVRALLVVALAAAVVSASGAALPAVPASLGELVLLGAGELAVGAALAFGLAAAFAAFLFAGRLLDVQFGFGIASLIDPLSRAPAPLLGTALNLAAVSVFFAADGHHLLIRALALSLEQFPPGSPIGELRLSAVAAQFGVMFVFGLALAAPALLAVLLLDLGFALASRTMPQMNVFIISIPFKIVLGLVVLAASLRYVGGAMTQLFESVFRYWSQLLP